MKNSEESAFGYGFANEQSHQEVPGLTKREYFAGLALSAGKSAKESIHLADEILKLLSDDRLRKINE